MKRSIVWSISEQKSKNDKFQKFKDSEIELLTLGERYAFIRGFSLGIRIAADALNYGKSLPD